MEPLRIDLWSDVACPWCWVGKRRFERALADFEERGRVQVRWHAFELDPAAPRELPGEISYVERLARKYRTSHERAEEMIRTMTDAGAGEGLALRFDRMRPGNTFDAHRVLHLAAEAGLADAAHERLFRAYLGEGEAIGRHDVLERLALEIGLDAADVRAVLASERFSAEVRADEQEAARRGIHGVPCFVLDGRRALSGAQPPEVLLQALRTE